MIAYRIIDNFINDNIVTQVKDQSFDENNTDFVEDPLICITYNDSILAVVFNGSDDPVFHPPAYANINWTKTEEIFKTIDFDTPKLSLSKEQFVAALSTLGLIRKLNDCLWRNSMFWQNATICSEIFINYWTSDQLTKINKTLFDLFATASENSGPDVRLEIFVPNQICYYVRMKNLIRSSQEQENFFKIGLRPDLLLKKNR